MLFQFLTDPIFDSIRPFANKILAASRRRYNDAVTGSQPSSCTICKQSFQRIQLHQNSSTSPNGCFNLARLRHYICLRKNIPFIPPSQIGNLSVSDLEQYLINLNWNRRARHPFPTVIRSFLLYSHMIISTLFRQLVVLLISIHPS